MKKILFTLAAILFGLTVYAQTGNVGGPIRDVEIVPKCDDRGATQVPFYDVVIYTVGESTGTVLGSFDVSGNSFTPTGSVSLGYCFEVVTSDDFEAIPRCDTVNNVSYVTLLRVTQAGAVSKLGDFSLTGGSVTPGASIEGWCGTQSQSVQIEQDTVTYSDPDQAYIDVTGSATYTAGIYESISILNIGEATGTVNLNGIGPVDLYPGQGLNIAGQLNPVTNEFLVNDQIVVDATGTTFRVIYREIEN